MCWLSDESLQITNKEKYNPILKMIKEYKLFYKENEQIAHKHWNAQLCQLLGTCKPKPQWDSILYQLG